MLRIFPTALGHLHLHLHLHSWWCLEVPLVILLLFELMLVHEGKDIAQLLECGTHARHLMQGVHIVLTFQKLLCFVGWRTSLLAHKHVVSSLVAHFGRALRCEILLK